MYKNKLILLVLITLLSGCSSTHQSNSVKPPNYQSNSVKSPEKCYERNMYAKIFPDHSVLCVNEEEKEQNSIFDKNGINTITKTTFDTNGYDINGYHTNGYDKNGFDKNGLNKEGYDKNGFYKDGFNKEGYDRNGYNSRGLNEAGLTKQEVETKRYHEQMLELERQKLAIDRQRLKQEQDNEDSRVLQDTANYLNNVRSRQNAIYNNNNYIQPSQPVEEKKYNYIHQMGPNLYYVK